MSDPDARSNLSAQLYKPEDREEKEKEVDYVITKFAKKGFESLSLEELAVTMVTPNFSKRFNTKTGKKWTNENQMKCVERLQRCNFDLTWMTKTGAGADVTTFFELIRGGDMEKVIEYMRRGRELLDGAVDSKKRTALHVAAEIGHSSLVDLLLNKQLSPHARDKLLRTPLHWAALNGHEVPVELLVKAGSDVFAKDSLGRTPFHYAASSGQGEDAGIRSLVIMASREPEIVHVTDNH